MLAQCLEGGESLTTQPKVLIVSIDNPASLIYFQRFSAFYGLRPRVKPPHNVSWFHTHVPIISLVNSRNRFSLRFCFMFIIILLIGCFLCHFATFSE